MFSYRLLLFFLSPFIYLYLAVHSLRNRNSRFFWQRTGFKTGTLPRHALWLHCASVGEVITILPLIKEIYRRHPDKNIIITTNTITGAKIVAQQKFAQLTHAYLPFDFSYAIKRFLHKIKPQLLLVVETEIWPNLFYYCNKNNCPISIINARLSIKTTAANNWVKSKLKTALQYPDHIYTRSQMDAAAYLALGAGNSKIETIGNLKYGRTGNTLKQPAVPVQRDYILAASTHNNEEYQITHIWLKLKRKELLFLAPRHPERCPGIIRQLKQLEPTLNIAIHSQHDTVTNQTDIYMLDTVGELLHYFSSAKLVIMGGSFVNIGGHNILEPAHYGRAILCGPYMDNFNAEKNLLLEKEALIQVQSWLLLEDKLNELLNNKEKIRRLENNVLAISDNFNHIVTDYANIIDGLLKKS